MDEIVVSNQPVSRWRSLIHGWLRETIRLGDRAKLEWTHEPTGGSR
jgi:hypothetical protein